MRVEYEEEDEEVVVFQPETTGGVFKGIRDKLFPPEEDNALRQKISIPRRIFNFYFPYFKCCSFTFWFGMLWLAWNTFIQCWYQLVELGKDEDGTAFGCTLLKMQCGSITPYISIKQGYGQVWRIPLSAITADDIATGVLGF